MCDKLQTSAVTVTLHKKITYFYIQVWKYPNSINYFPLFPYNLNKMLLTRKTCEATFLYPELVRDLIKNGINKQN